MTFLGLRRASSGQIIGAMWLVFLTVFVITGLVFAHKVIATNGTMAESMMAFWVYGSIGVMVSGFGLLLIGLL